MIFFANFLLALVVEIMDYMAAFKQV